MKKIFVKTTNVKNFIGFVENLLNKPKNIPKMGLIYGEPALGKSQTALWLSCKYDVILFRWCTHLNKEFRYADLLREGIITGQIQRIQTLSDSKYTRF